MSRSEGDVGARLAAWASRQLADYDARRPGSLFAEGLVLDVADGYRLQAAVAELRAARGEQPIGYKVGCTSPRIRAQLGIDHCVSGRLFASERHVSGAVLQRSDYAHLAVEGELAVELSGTPSEQDLAEAEGIPGCVARVFPVIELHNHVLRGRRPTAGELIAHNAIHAGYVAGDGVVVGGSLGEPSLAVRADGRLLEQCAGPALIETIRSSIRWLAGTLPQRGDRLKAGQTILTGSIPRLIPVGEDGLIRVDAPPFGGVEARFGP